MAGLFDDILNQDGGGQVLIDKSGRFDKLNPNFQNQILGLANDFYAQYKTPLIITDTYRTQSEQADAHMRKPSLALPAGASARHPMGLAIDIDQNQAKMIDPQLLSNYRLGLPAINKGETWHIEPVVNQSQSTSSPQSGLFDNILSQSKPQPGKVASIPEMVGPALQQEPQSLESRVGEFGKGFLNYIPQGLKENAPLMGMLGGGATGARLGAVAGPFGALGGGIIGAGLGGMAGGQARNIAETIEGKNLPSIPEQLMEAGKEGLSSSMGWMGGENVGAILQKLVGGAMSKGVKSALDMDRYNMAQDLAKQGVFVDPTTISKPGIIGRSLAWLVNKIEPGKSITQAYRQKMMDALVDMRNNFIEQTIGLPPVGSMRAGEAPETITKVFQRFKETNPNAEISLNNVAEWIGGLDASAVPAKSKELFNIIKGATSKPLNPNELEKLNSYVWQNYKKLSYQDRNFRNDFLSSLYEDLTPHGLDEPLKFAKATTRQIKQAKFIEGLLTSASSRDGQIFYPQSFSQLIRKKETDIVRTLNPEQAKMLFNFGEQMGFAGETEKIMKKVAGEKNWAYTQASRIPAILTGAGAGAGMVTGTGASPMILLPLGAQSWMAWSFIKPSGTIRKLFTTGLPTFPGKAGLATKVGLTKYFDEKFGIENE